MGTDRVTQREVQVRVGCDVQSIIDIREGLVDFGDRYLRRILSDAERASIVGDVTDASVVRYTAGRFAAKEAVFKILRWGPEQAFGWPDIEILADTVGAPTVRLTAPAEALALGEGIEEISVSISHATPFAFAVATALVATRRSAAVGSGVDE
ncbi:holo-ACP synthase [Agromyces larvae]|uniref:Holo-[acyl-carrier-protein] synthase n=1 Tax=Agromyces larvae TaxID=2929802 RepID=A0ABY4BUE2_9MICO|nr:holo-ACP synthase [Agromyces larvae]UOE42765.1 holo-ACP synthase [Agromyces larvae]